MLNQFFGSKVRALILETILSDLETDYYSRLLEKVTKMDHKAIWKELNHLEESKIVTSYQDGRLKRYKVNDFPGKEDLRNFILAATGKSPNARKKRSIAKSPDLPRKGLEQLTLI